MLKTVTARRASHTYLAASRVNAVVHARIWESSSSSSRNQSSILWLLLIHFFFSRRARFYFLFVSFACFRRLFQLVFSGAYCVRNDSDRHSENTHTHTHELEHPFPATYSQVCKTCKLLLVCKHSYYTLWMTTTARVAVWVCARESETAELYAVQSAQNMRKWKKKNVK